MATAAQQAQTAITIRRDSPDDVQQRQVVVKLDGERIAELLYGDSVTLPVTPGHHKLLVDNTWNWKTLELDIALGDHPKFVVKNHVSRLASFFMFALGAGPMHVSIQPEE